jgi:hypothetical protein
VDAGSRQENASKQESRVPDPSHSNDFARLHFTIGRD